MYLNNKLINVFFLRAIAKYMMIWEDVKDVNQNMF